MSNLYPWDSAPNRSGYQRTPRVPGPFASEERPLRYWIIALPILLALGASLI